MRNITIAITLVFLFSFLPAEEKTETIHPYLWQGVTVAGFGAVLFINGIIFNALADKEYDKYRSLSSDAEIAGAINQGKDKTAYISAAKKHIDDGNGYAATRTISYITGGIFIASGAILMLITEDKRDVPKVGVAFDKNGAMLSLSFNY